MLLNPCNKTIFEGTPVINRDHEMTKLFAIIIILVLTGCMPLATGNASYVDTEKELIYDNFTYEQNIKTVQLYPTLSGLVEVTQPPILPLLQRDQLILSFDHLYAESEDFRVKLIHCNANWQPSNFSSIEILNNYNEFRIDDYQPSFNTRVPYVHYKFVIPEVKIAGNYLLVVYRGGNENDLILSNRFMIVQNIALIKPAITLSSGVLERVINQQIDFTIDYTNLEVRDPMNEIKVVVRQNNRWDNAIKELKPTFVKDFIKQLNYEFFDLSNNFKGGNEFRFFDLRSINFPGQNVNKIEKNDQQITANLMVDRPRQNEAYTYIQDLNGSYVIEKIDAVDPDIEADYVMVNFFLKSKKYQNTKLYALGSLNQWKRIPENRLIYSDEAEGYLGRQFVKQGWYNFLYYFEGNTINNPYVLEGSHSQTENMYEILVYFRKIGSRGDVLAGYSRFNTND